MTQPRNPMSENDPFRPRASLDNGHSTDEAGRRQVRAAHPRLRGDLALSANHRITASARTIQEPIRIDGEAAVYVVKMGAVRGEKPAVRELRPFRDRQQATGCGGSCTAESGGCDQPGEITPRLAP